MPQGILLCFRRGAQCFSAGPRGSAWHFNAVSVASYASANDPVSDQRRSR